MHVASLCRRVESAEAHVIQLFVHLTFTPSTSSTSHGDGEHASLSKVGIFQHTNGMCLFVFVYFHVMSDAVAMLSSYEWKDCVAPFHSQRRREPRASKKARRSIVRVQSRRAESSLLHFLRVSISVDLIKFPPAAPRGRTAAAPCQRSPKIGTLSNSIPLYK